MDYQGQIDLRINDAVLEMVQNLKYAIRKADKKPTIELAELIKSLSISISTLMPFVTGNEKKEADEKI